MKGNIDRLGQAVDNAQFAGVPKAVFRTHPILPVKGRSIATLLTRPTTYTLSGSNAALVRPFALASKGFANICLS